MLLIHSFLNSRFSLFNIRWADGSTRQNNPKKTLLSFYDKMDEKETVSYDYSL